MGNKTNNKKSINDDNAFIRNDHEKAYMDFLNNSPVNKVISGKKENRSRNNQIHTKGSKSTVLFKTTNGINVHEEESHLSIKVANIIQETKGHDSKYQIVSKIAHGSMGTVFIANNTCTHHQVAIKFTSKTNIKCMIDNLELKNEINILKSLVHPNIMRIFSFAETNDDYLLVGELCSLGELYAKITRGFSELELSMIMYQLFSALSYCHENTIIHRDLKLENILIRDIEKLDVDSSLTELFWIKLIDFGTAKTFSRKRNEKTIIGTSYYIAPEVLMRNYNEKCDTWSAGVILYILLVGGAPFDGKNDSEIYRKIREGTFKSNTRKYVNSSPECQDLIKKLLEVDIEKRLSPKEAMNHPWFTKMNTIEIMYKLSPEKVKKYLANLMSYNIQSKVQQLVLSFLSHNSNDIEDMRDIWKLFLLFDVEKKGKLTKDNLIDGFIRLGINRMKLMTYIDERFALIDSDNDGFIEYEEFLRAALDRKKLLSEEMIQFGFSYLDSNKTNSFTANSIKDCFAINNPRITNSLCKKMFNEITSTNVEAFYEDYYQFIKEINY